MSVALIRLDFRLPDTDLDLPAEMLAPPPSLRNLLLNRTALIIYSVIILGSGGLGFSTWSLGQREKNIRANIVSLEATGRQYKVDIENAEKLSARRSGIRAYMDTVRAVDQHRYAVVHALDQIARLMPRDTWLERFETVRADSATNTTIMRLTAITPTADLVAEYQRALESSPWLRNVQFDNSESVNVSGQQAVRFRLLLETRKPEAEFLTTESITPEGLVSGPRMPRMPPANAPVLTPLETTDASGGMP